MRKLNVKKVVISILAILLIICISLVIFYKLNLKPVNSKGDNEVVRVVIPEGIGVKGISDVLYENNLIKNKLVMQIYVKLHKISLQAGKYDLNRNEDLKATLTHIQNGEVANDEVKITFIEGKNMKWIAKTIADKTNNTEDDVFNLLKDKEYINSLIEKYWFITEEVNDERIYYPLEGYLLPDTYTFENEDVSVKTIFNIMLNFMDKKLTSVKDDLDAKGYTVHQMLTLASITELEGNSDEDRAQIISVILNRINKKMSLGSDVTAYYAFQVDMGERNLTKTELSTYNPYNTRGPNMSGKIPVGPICNPSMSSIKAVFNSAQTDYLYFVADKNGKVYFTKTNEEHNNMIQKLKSEGLWYTYN